MNRIFLIWVFRRLWSAGIQFLFNFQLIIDILNITTLFRSLSSYLLATFITVTSVKRGSILFGFKVIYTADKFIWIQIILKVLLLEICLKSTECNVLTALIMQYIVFGLLHFTVSHIYAWKHDPINFTVMYSVLTSRLICLRYCPVTNVWNPRFHKSGFPIMGDCLLLKQDLGLWWYIIHISSIVYKMSWLLMEHHEPGISYRIQMECACCSTTKFHLISEHRLTMCHQNGLHR